jgi:hypothetical protein
MDDEPVTTDVDFQATVQRCEKLLGQIERSQAAFSLRPAQEVPQTAIEKLAAAEAMVQKLLLDQSSTQEARRRALVVRDRAQLAAADEAKRAQTFSAMARSMSLRADAAAAKDVAETRRQRERDAADKAAEDAKWADARRRKYISDGR